MSLQSNYPELAICFDFDLLLEVFRRLLIVAKMVENHREVLADIKQRGMLNAHPYWRDGGYLELIERCTDDPAHRRQYIGVDKAKQAEALRLIENWKRYEAIAALYDQERTYLRAVAGFLEDALRQMLNHLHFVQDASAD